MFLEGCFLKSIVFYIGLLILLFAELRQGDALLRGFALLIRVGYQSGVLYGVGLCRADIVFLLFLGFHLTFDFVFALEGDYVFSFLNQDISTIIRAISSFASYFFIDLKV